MMTFYLIITITCVSLNYDCYYNIIMPHYSQINQRLDTMVLDTMLYNLWNKILGIFFLHIRSQLLFTQLVASISLKHSHSLCT